LVTFFTWLVSLEWFHGLGFKVRLALLLISGILLALGLMRVWTKRKVGDSEERILTLRPLAPGLVLALLSVLHLPHAGWTVWLMVLLTAALSAASWWGEWVTLRRSLRSAMTPFLISQVLFLIGFCF